MILITTFTITKTTIDIIITIISTTIIPYMQYKQSDKAYENTIHAIQNATTVW